MLNIVKYECCIYDCVHHVTVLNAAFCMACSLLMLVEDARGDYMEETYSGIWVWSEKSASCFVWIQCKIVVLSMQTLYESVVVCISG